MNRGKKFYSAHNVNTRNKDMVQPVCQRLMLYKKKNIVVFWSKGVELPDVRNP